MQCRIIQFRRCQSGSWVMDLSWPRIQFRTVHNPSSFKTCTQLVAKYKIDVRIERKHARLGVVIGLLQNIPLPRSHLAAGPAARQVSFFGCCRAPQLWRAHAVAPGPAHAAPAAEEALTLTSEAQSFAPAAPGEGEGDRCGT